MVKTQNSIRKQRLLVHLDREADALLLRPRLSDINREMLVPAIERVLDELTVPEQRIKIDRLAIDLGTLPLDCFAEEAQQRLETVLRRRLRDILHEAMREDNHSGHNGSGHNGSDHNNAGRNNVDHHKVDHTSADHADPDSPKVALFSESEQHSQLRLLEHYLVKGVLPWHVHDKAGFSCETLFLTLAGEQQDAVVDIIVAHHRLPRVIERLVFQLREESLTKLLQLLEPQNADLILAYILDLGVTHMRYPVLPVNARDFDRLVWMLTLTYSVRERGTQFNRKSYLKSLIQGMAQREGLKYPDMLAALHLGLKKIMKTRPLKSTLPALIATLAGEKSPADEKDGRAIYEDLADTVAMPVGRPPAIREDPAIETASVVFQRYDRFDMLRYYLEHGTLRHRDPLDPTPTIGEVVAFLSQIPPLWIKAVFDFNDDHAQWNAVVRAVEALSETELLLLLKKLVPANEAGGTQFHTSVRAVAQQAKNNVLYYSHLLAALFNNRNLDLEMFADSTNTTMALSSDNVAGANAVSTNIVSANVAGDSHQQLKARFLATLEQLFDTDAGKPTLASPTEAMTALQSLLAKQAIDTRGFILDIQSTPGLAEKKFAPFLENLSNHEFEQLLSLAQPEIFTASKALTTLLASIPVPYRPGIGKLRDTILAEAIKFEHPRADDFFTRVLRALFPTPLSKPLAEHLFTVADTWQRNDNFKTDQVSGFRMAINRCVDGLPVSETAREVAGKNESQNEFSNWQNSIFSSLLPAQILRQSKYVELRKLATVSRDRLPAAINRLVMQSPDRFSLFVREHIIHEPVREYWTGILPESSLVRFVWLLEPQQLRALLASAETLAAAWLDNGERAGGANITGIAEGRRELWLFLLEFFARHSGANCTLSAMTSAFFDHFSLDAGVSENTVDKRSHRAQLVQTPSRALLDSARRLAGTMGQNQLLAILHDDRQLLLAGKDERKRARKTQRSQKQPSPSTRPRFKTEPESSEAEEILYIDNAGLVLIGVFLPHLFKSLDMLHTNAEGKIRLRDKATFSRGVHMLQYLVNGSTSAPEPLLPLNKILCGESVHATIEPGIELTEQETGMCNQLLQAAIANWKIISTTSIEGLQETFLQREGRLVQVDNGWKLTVQRKTVDVLLDQTSWSFSVISHAWMPDAVYVSW